MEILRRFCTRKAEPIQARIEHVAVNLENKTFTVMIAECDKPGSKMRMTLQPNEASRLMGSFRVGLAGMEHTPVITEPDRLDWLLNHPQAIFNRGALDWTVVVHLPADSMFADGVEGDFVVKAPNRRDCIDGFLMGKARRIA